jgi:hypothetical protein
MQPDARVRWSWPVAAVAALTPLMLIAARRQLSRVTTVSPRLVAPSWVRPLGRLPLPERHDRVVNGVARRLPGSFTCLERALASCWLARLCGADAELVLGVAKDGAQVRAHAWLSGDVPAEAAYRRIWQSAPAPPTAPRT